MIHTNNKKNDLRGLVVFRRTFNLFFTFTGKIHKQNNNHQQGCSELCPRNIFSQIYHNSSSLSSAKIASFQKIIANTISNVKVALSWVPLIAATNQTTTRFEQTAEKTLSWATEIININSTLTNLNLLVKSGQKGFVRFTKKTLISILGVWIVIVSSGLLYLFGPWTAKTAEAAWFDDNWAYNEETT